jgi:hypothetical protein
LDDLGPQIAYVALEHGTPVYDRDGQHIGVVVQVLGDLPDDVFDGLLVHTRPLPGRHLFAAFDQIAELRERGVVLKVGRNDLREPPGGRRRGSGRTPLGARLRRAWDRLSGRG